MNWSTMKRSTVQSKATFQPGADEILPEYDFSRASRHKYASRYAAGSAVVVLEPDAAAAFRKFSRRQCGTTRHGRNRPEASLPPPVVVPQF